MDWLSPYVVHSVLPEDYEDIKATPDSELAEKVESLKKWIENLDFEKRHSLEPVMAPHYLKKIEQGSRGNG